MKFNLRFKPIQPRSLGVHTRFPRPGEPVAPWWHVFHKWSEWKRSDGEIKYYQLRGQNPPGESIELQRTCTKCGKSQYCSGVYMHMYDCPDKRNYSVFWTFK